MKTSANEKANETLTQYFSLTGKTLKQKVVKHSFFLMHIFASIQIMLHFSVPIALLCKNESQADTKANEFGRFSSQRNFFSNYSE